MRYETRNSRKKDPLGIVPVDLSFVVCIMSTLITSIVPLTQLPGRLAVFVLATILVFGLWNGINHNQEATRSRDSGSDPSRLLLESMVTPSSTGSLRSGDNSQSVTVQVSIESLCIDSKNYVLEQLVPTFASPLGEVMDLQVVVFGNAHLHTDTRTVTCQHGDAECDANVYQQCAIDNFVYPSRYLPFLACLFETLPMGHADAPFDVSYFAQCARSSALDFRALQSCHTADAWAMQVQSAAKTPSNHDHVPWVVIDGVYVPEEQSSLPNIICEALQKKGGSNAFCDTL